jgi:(1->4)-alpha-D-glucan 1-alpha-D-glucosylmutase
VTRAALTLRRDRPELFTTYAPVAVSGPAADHALAFDRGGAVTVATRLPAGLAAGDGWGMTVLDLPAGRWCDVITGRTLTSSADGLAVAEALTSLPVALLVREESRAPRGAAAPSTCGRHCPSGSASLSTGTVAEWSR